MKHEITLTKEQQRMLMNEEVKHCSDENLLHFFNMLINEIASRGAYVCEGWTPYWEQKEEKK